MSRHRFKRPAFDEENPYNGFRPCEICGEMAMEEFGETESHPDTIDVWTPLCNEHRETRLKTGVEATEEILNPLLGMEPPDLKEPPPLD